MNTLIAFIKRPGEVKKGYVWLITFLTTLIASGYLHGTTYHYVAVALTFLGFVGGTFIKNDPFTGNQAPTTYTAPPVTGE